MERQFNLELDENGMVSSKEIHKFLGVKMIYANWIKYWIKNLSVKEGKDFIPFLEKSTGGRRSTDFFVNKDMATTLVMVSNAEFADEFRKYLISLFDKRGNLELITIEESVIAHKILDCLSYIDNQKEAYVRHKNSYTEKNTAYGNIYAKFNSYRHSITGWNKEKIENAIKEFILKDQHPVKTTNQTEMLNIIDCYEAIRVACLDLLLSENDNIDSANKFADLIKKIAKAKNVKPLSKNETDLFHTKDENAKIDKLNNDIKKLKD
jgi:phage anti-repressor protein